MIKPSPGRVVWFFLSNTMAGFAGNAGVPHAAIVAAVNDDRNVNLAVFDANGLAHPHINVPLVQEGDTEPGGNFARWMPFQIGQAAKTEQALDAPNIATTALLIERLNALEATVAALMTPMSDAQALGQLDVGASLASGGMINAGTVPGQAVAQDGALQSADAGTPLQPDAVAALEAVGQEAAADLSKMPPPDATATGSSEQPST